MELSSISKKQSSIILFFTVMLHMLIMMLIFRQHMNLQQKYIPFPLQDDYLVQQILSSGRLEPSATVIFQDEQTTTDAQSDLHDAIKPLQELAQALSTQADALIPDNQNQEESLTLQAPEYESTDDTKKEQPKVGTMITADRGPESAKPKRRAKKAQEKTATQQQNITLADISRGFIKSMKQEAGHNNATRDIKQLALQMYATKVWNLIKSAFLTSDSYLHLPRAVSVHSQLIVTINRSGMLLDIQLAYPKHMSEIREIEQLLISRAKQAGLFPPLPQEVQGETKRFSFPLYIEAEEGFHSYSLSYR